MKCLLNLRSISSVYPLGTYPDKIPDTRSGSSMERRILYSGVIAALLSGCGSTPERATDLTLQQQTINTSGAERANSAASSQAAIENVDLISVDLINALSQIGGVHPAETVLHMEPPATRFGKALRTVLEQAGYGLRILPGTDSSEVFSHAVTKLSEERDGVLNSYQIVVGDIRLKREYFEQPYGVTPSSNMFVIGANPSEITLNDELFEIASTQTTDVTPEEPKAAISPVEVTIDDTQASSENASPEKTVIENINTEIQATLVEEPDLTEPVTIEVPVGTAAHMPLDSDAKATLAASTTKNGNSLYVVPSLGDGDTVKTNSTVSVIAEVKPSKQKPLIQSSNDVDFTRVIIKGNRYELGRSNYTELLVNYSDLKKDILIFPNDSLRLGRENKGVLSTFIRDFLEDSDVISVIGCSHGRTKLTNGNAVLATGRAQRVKEALLFSGIPENRIYEEGCWSAKYHNEVMPSRGVIITHKRERQNG